MNQYLLLIFNDEPWQTDANSPQEAIDIYQRDIDPDNKNPVVKVYVLTDVTPDSVGGAPIDDGVSDNAAIPVPADLPTWWNKP